MLKDVAFKDVTAHSTSVCGLELLVYAALSN